MRSSTTMANQLDLISDPTWSRLVGNLLETEPTDVRVGRTEEISAGAGTGTQVFRVTGTAGTAGTAARPAVAWTMVIKLLTQQGSAFFAAGREPTAWNYWKREWHVYRSGWTAALPGPLVAARCLGTGEVAPVEGGDEAAWIALEDLAASEPSGWPLRRFGDVARHLGLFNGRHLDGRHRAEEPWLCRQWLRGWTEQSGAAIARLPEAARHPVAGRIFTADVIEDLEWAWTHRHLLYATLDGLPETLCHNDLFPRNLFVTPGPDVRSVAIDWAFCGPAPIGQELVALVSASQIFRECPTDRWEALERVCLDGYTAGLRQSGTQLGEEAYVGYLLSTVLRFGAGSVPPVLEIALTTGHARFIEEVFGCSYDDFIAHSVAVMRFQQRRIRRARALLGL